MSVIIIDNYDSFTYNLYQLVRQICCVEASPRSQENVGDLSASGTAAVAAAADLHKGVGDLCASGAAVATAADLRKSGGDSSAWSAGRASSGRSVRHRERRLEAELPLPDDAVLVFRNDEVSFAELKAYSPSHIILSPGPGHPANDNDFGICGAIIGRYEEFSRRPAVLGVCLGHQGIVHHLGGKVVQAPEIVHGKQSEIIVTGATALFGRVQENFKAMRYHSLIAEDATLPECLEVIARDLLKGLIMAVAHKSVPMYGIQFHPESIGTPVGRTILENFLRL